MLKDKNKMAASKAVKSSGATGGGPQSVGRILAILDLVAANRDGATLTELAAYANAPKTSLVGLVKALVEEKALRREASGRYVFDERIYSFAARVSPGLDLVRVARPFLTRLMLATGETVVLGTPARDADLVVYIDKVETESPVRYTVNVGERREMYCTSMGKAILAHSPKAQIDRVLSPANLMRFTHTTITSPDELRKQLADIRAEGIARTHGERVEGADGMAAPLLDVHGGIIAAVLIAGPSSRVAAHRSRMERELLETIKELQQAVIHPVVSAG